MDVRRIRADEIDPVGAIWHEARCEIHAEMGVATGVATLDEGRRIFRASIAPACEIWVAERDGELLGFLALRGSYVDRLYVRPGAQRSGVGSALLDKARELSPLGLELHTHRKNRRARGFYAKHAFRAVAFGVSPPPESEPDVEYWWRPEWGKTVQSA